MIYFLFGLGTLFIAAGLGVSSATIVGWLDPRASGAHLALLAQGAVILKACLTIDGLLLFAAAGYPALRRDRATARAPVPSWTADPEIHRAGALPDPVYVVGLAGLLSLALILRWPGLDGDLWRDEILALTRYVRNAPGMFLTTYGDNNHVLYSLLAHASIAGFGESAVAYRLPAVLCGVASIYATGRLALLVVGRQGALFAMALLTLAYHHVWFSQNARGYTLLLLATVVATELLLRGLANNRFGTWLAYAVTLAIGAWTHLTMAFVAAAHGLILVWVVALAWRRGTPRTVDWRPLAALAFAGWLAVHLLALAIPQMLASFSRPGAGSSSGAPEWKTVTWMVMEVVRQTQLPIVPAFIALVAGGGVAAWVLVRCARRDPVFVAALILPGAICAATILVLGRNLWPRLFFNSIGFVAIIAVLGAGAVADALGRLTPLRPATGRAAIIALMCLAAAAMLPKVYRYPKQDLTGARDFVLANAAADDRILAVDSHGAVYNDYLGLGWTIVNSVDELRAHRAARGRTWVVYMLPNRIGGRNPGLLDLLETEFELMRVYPGTLGDGQVIVRRGPPSKRGNP